MDEKFDRLIGRIESMFSKWLGDFEQRPVSAALKVVVILWLVKWVRRNLL